MSEKNDILIENSSKNSEKISVGAALRKQRISMNLSVERISKDLRISKIYIEAIESDKFDLIPATAYVRVYVKTIAEYLSLDSKKLLKQLSEENTKIARLYTTEISVVEEKPPLNISISEKKKNAKFGLLALLVIILLILAYFVVNQNSSFLEYDDDSDNETAEIIAEEPDTDGEYNMPDSLIRGDTIITEDSAVVQQDTVDTLAALPEKIEMTLQVVSDSSWVQIVSDGKISFDRTLRAPSRVVRTSANDSINVYAGGGYKTVDIFINGKRISKAGATGIWTFTKSENRNLTPADWRKVKRTF